MIFVNLEKNLKFEGIYMEKDKLNLNIAIEENQRKEVCSVLQKLLASSYALYLKTQNFHWNVTGVQFYSFHLLFQNQYEELAEAIDEIAERIRALGFFPAGSFSEFLKWTIIKDETKLRSAKEMIEQLVNDHETLICFLREYIPLVEKIKDGATADFINKRLAIHEKTSWMLRSAQIFD